MEGFPRLLLTYSILDDEDIEDVTGMVTQMLAARNSATASDGGWKGQFVDAMRCEGSVDHLGESIPPGREAHCQLPSAACRYAAYQK